MSENQLTEPQRLWIEALRSGIFKQTTHVLCRLDEKGEPVGFCCLGVACEIAREAGVEVPVGTDTMFAGDADDEFRCRTYANDEGDVEYTYLPGRVRDWLGLVSDMGRYKAGATLASHNDAGETFERIADIIESRPTGLFVEESS